MAPPTQDEIIASISQLIDDLVKKNESALFEWKYLVDEVRRQFGSTTQAVAARMSLLSGSGRLARVLVTHGGYVRLTKDLSTISWNLYFAYHRNYERDASRNWGFVTTTRPGPIENLWANGERYLYTTRERLEVMEAHFTKQREEHLERLRQRGVADESAFWETLEKSDPDARELLARLLEAVPGMEETHRMGNRRTEPIPCLNLDLRDVEQISALLAVVRDAGLSGDGT